MNILIERIFTEWLKCCNVCEHLCLLFVSIFLDFRFRTFFVVVRLCAVNKPISILNIWHFLLLLRTKSPKFHYVLNNLIWNAWDISSKVTGYDPLDTQYPIYSVVHFIDIGLGRYFRLMFLRMFRTQNCTPPLSLCQKWNVSFNTIDQITFTTFSFEPGWAAKHSHLQRVNFKLQQNTNKSILLTS